MNCEKTTRKSTRLKGYDYSSSKYYFITLCTSGHQCVFGHVNTTKDNGEMRLNRDGELLERHIKALDERYHSVRVDKYIIMPNHVHMILALDNENRISVSQIIGLFKSGVSKEMGRSVWQRSFHDHIIRNESDYRNIWNYINNNPAKWALDRYYIAT